MIIHKSSPYTYCPKCGGGFFQENTYKFVCAKCTYEHYINPAPCVGILLHDEKGRILLGRRKYAPYKGTWDTIGGFIDPDESLEAAARREAEEELGIAITDVSYIASITDVYPWHDIAVPILTFLVEAKAEKIDAIIPSDDVAELKFFAAEMLPYDEIAMDNLRDFLKEYTVEARRL